MAHIDLKHTPLEQEHIKLGAKMVEFGGWWMPVQYTNVIHEHISTRTKAGLFDISHMGELVVEGRDALPFLQRMITNDLSKLADGKCIYGLMCYENSGTVDDCFTYRFNENRYMVVVNASNEQKDFEWLKKHSQGFGVRIESISSRLAKIDIQGPNSELIFQKMTDYPLKGLKRFFFAEFPAEGIKTITSRTGYTGEGGFEIYFPWEKASFLWSKFLEAGKEHGLVPCGLGARDTLRIEACYSLYGHEINENISPIEAGLGWAVKPEKGDFIGKEVLAKQKEFGTDRRLICFEMVERGIAREHYPIFHEGSEIGLVTSGTFSPTFQKPLGMGLVNRFLQAGDHIDIKIRDKTYRAKIVKRPFYEFCGANLRGVMNGKP